MKFYTRAKKPHLYDVLIVSVIVVAASILISVLSGGGCALISVILFDMFFAYAIARLITAFIGQLQYNPYSYNIVYYSGFALFLLFVFVTDVILTVKMIMSADIYIESKKAIGDMDTQKTMISIVAECLGIEEDNVSIYYDVD